MTTEKKTKVVNWLKAAGVRAIKTFAQSLVAYIGVATAFSEVNWASALSTAGIAALLSLLMSIAGLPELNDKPIKDVEFDPAYDEANQDDEALDDNINYPDGN
jgi:hypothetical protein